MSSKRTSKKMPTDKTPERVQIATLPPGQALPTRLRRRESLEREERELQELRERLLRIADERATGTFAIEVERLARAAHRAEGLELLARLLVTPQGFGNAWEILALHVQALRQNVRMSRRLSRYGKGAETRRQKAVLASRLKLIGEWLAASEASGQNIDRIDAPQLESLKSCLNRNGISKMPGDETLRRNIRMAKARI